MAKKHKYTVTHAGQTFTRTTARTYTHIILGKHDKEQDLRRAYKRARYDADVNHDFYIRESGPNAKYPEQRTEEELTEYRRIASITPEQFYQERLAKALDEISEREGRGFYTHFVDLAWAGRPDLAIKEVASCQKHGWIEVFALEVPPINS